MELLSLLNRWPFKMMLFDLGGGGSVQSQQMQPMYPGFDQAMQSLGNKAASNVGMLGQPYGGSMVAGFTPAQTASQNYLQNYLRTPAASADYTQNPLYQAATQNLQNTVSGQYVSPDNPYTKAYNSWYMGQIYPQQQQMLNQQLARTGSLAGSGAQYQMEQLANQTGQNLGLVGAQMQMQERQNQLNSLPLAMNTAQAGQYAPYSQEMMLYQMGLPAQQQQQQELSAAYNDWLRSHGENLMPLQNAAQYSQIYPQMQYSYDPGWGGTLGGIGTLLGGIGSIAGGPIGSAIGGLFGGGGSNSALNDYLGGAFEFPF